MNSEPRVYLDACCFIDMVAHDLSVGVRQDRASHVYYCRKFLEAARGKEAHVFTSTLTVAECLGIKDESDAKNHKSVLTDEVKRLFEGMLLSAKSGVMPVQPTPRIVKSARDLRWAHAATFKPMDSLHIATAIDMKCGYFLTTDSRLKSENIAIAKALGLVVCTADSIASLLPSKYQQLPLIPSKATGIAVSLPA
jgi:predicted nucleic acid-binding protein